MYGAFAVGTGFAVFPPGYNRRNRLGPLGTGVYGNVHSGFDAGLGAGYKGQSLVGMATAIFISLDSGYWGVFLKLIGLQVRPGSVTMPG